MGVSSLVITIATFVTGIVADYSCHYKPNWNRPERTTSCDWGCCYYYLSDPCCLKPYYAYPGFITGIVSGSIFLIGMVVAVIAYQRRRRMLLANQVIYARTQPAVAQHVFSTSTTTTGQAMSPPPYAPETGYTYGQAPPSYGQAAPPNYGQAAPPNYGQAPPAYGYPQGYNNQGYSVTSTTNISK